MEDSVKLLIAETGCLGQLVNGRLGTLVYFLYGSPYSLYVIFSGRIEVLEQKVLY